MRSVFIHWKLWRAESKDLLANLRAHVSFDGAVIYLSSPLVT